MAIDTLPPWLNVSPSDFVRAAQAGASAGLEAGALEQRGRSDAARLALEAQSINQRAEAEAAQLAEHERVANMEMKARQEIAEQNRLRQSQEDLIQNAYRTAQIGLGKQRIADQQAVAAAKARDAALQFADEQAFAQEIASGTKIPEAMMKHPRVRPSVVSALASTTTMALPAPQEISPGVRILQTSPNRYQVLPKQVDAAKQEKLKTLHAELKRLGDLYEVSSEADRPGIQARIDENERKRIALTTEEPRVKGTAEDLLRKTGMEIPTTAEPSGKRVRVRSKEGKVGTIPAEQLEEALAEGYTQL